jgi:hypothetical protein
LDVLIHMEIHVEKRKFLTLPGLELRPLGRPTRSQSLHRLLQPGSHTTLPLTSSNELHNYGLMSSNIMILLHYVFKYTTRNNRNESPKQQYNNASREVTSKRRLGQTYVIHHMHYSDVEQVAAYAWRTASCLKASNQHTRPRHSSSVSRCLPTAAARIRARVWQVGFVVDKVALGQVFSENFGFPCQSLFHQILHHHNHPERAQ